MFRVAWSTPMHSGYGEFVLEKEIATAWVIYLNEKYPDMKHWTEHSTQKTEYDPAA
jgi:hypothetical protein